MDRATEEEENRREAKRFLRTTGFVLFFFSYFTSINYVGILKTGEALHITSALLLWSLNALAGILSGLLFYFKKPKRAAFSGLCASLSITASALLYHKYLKFSNATELLLPILTGIICGINGFIIPGKLYKKYRLLLLLRSRKNNN